METWHIHIKGQVQGVGFRPFVYRLAKEVNICGSVSNGNDGVHICMNASEEEVNIFCHRIDADRPAQSIITDVMVSQIEPIPFTSFKIIGSENEGAPSVLLSPDFAICSACADEVINYQDRRYHYPFTTCTECGPRLSIIRSLPYDRETTAMSPYSMCNTCKEEYNDVSDRRFYSQTNSCSECGISLYWYPSLPEVNHRDFPTTAADLIKSGNIVAVKSTGGFLLLCDATDANVVSLLRERKNRPLKPLAVMFKDINEAHRYVDLSDAAVELLNSSIRPIVISPVKAEGRQKLAVEHISPGLNTIGVMTPADPLLHLISRAVNKPLIATSANTHNAPIIFENEAAINALESIADYILYHDRDIVIPQDDSVVKFGLFSSRCVIIRRGRGFAPTFNTNLHIDQSVLALGADLKGSFAITSTENIYLSPSLGNQMAFDAQKQYHHCLDRYLETTNQSPEVVLRDKHNGYFSAQYAESFPNAAVDSVQHHKAHFSSLLWEYNMLDTDEKVLGVIWDGIGIGDDDNIWGGEFFVYAKRQMKRCAHFDYFDYLLGDKMSKDTRLSAFSIFYNSKSGHSLLRPLFSDQEWHFFNKVISAGQSVKTSSVGRIFDGLACLLGLVRKQDYEGQAAMLLEQLARDYLADHQIGLNDHYPFLRAENFGVSTQRIAEGIMEDFISKKPIGYISAKFHNTLVNIVDVVAVNNRCRHIGFSGGVFQNTLLIDLLEERLSNTYTLLFHKDLSPNDENIAVGQIAYFHIHQQEQKAFKPDLCMRNSS